GRALAEGGVAGPLQPVAVLLHDGLHGVPRARGPLADALDDRAVERGVAEDEQLGFEDAAGARAELLVGDGDDLPELALGPRHGPLEPVHLGLDVAGLDALGADLVGPAHVEI